MSIRYGCSLAVLVVWACTSLADEPTAGSAGVGRQPPVQPTAALGVYRPAESSVARYFVAAAASDRPTFLPGQGGALESGFEELRRAAPAVTFTAAAGTLTLRPGLASIGKSVVYDAARDLSGLLTAEDPSCPLDWRVQHSPLSLTGELFTYEKVESGQMACGPPGSSGRVQAVNLRTLRPANIEEFVSASSLLEALRRDTWVRRRGASETEASHGKYLQELDGARTSKEMIPVLSRRLGFDASELWTHFCVLGYEAKNRTASMRLVATRSAGFDRTKYLQLGVVVQPLPAYEEVLATVTESTGFFAGRFANGVVKKASPTRARE